MKWGAVAIADPWFPAAAPTTPAIGMGAKDYPTTAISTRLRFLARSLHEVTDADVLQSLFEDDVDMQGIFNRALVESIVSIEADGS